ncbi:hypothetical protein [Macrococcus animalis]|uniref:hypothetical protein n=1 Tax=Macrococcus animalis TaxID=3395467 RepID=UPI0039BE651D
MNHSNEDISKIISIINDKILSHHQLDNEDYDIISIKNTSKTNVSIETFETLIKLTTYLRANNIEYSISYQYKENKFGIHHIDVSVVKN